MTLLSEIMSALILFFGTLNVVRMVLFMVGSDIYGLRASLRKKRFHASKLPTISVVIPAHNEEVNVLHSLHSLVEHALYPAHKLEVVVVDDGSSDNTAQLVRNYIDSHRRTNVTLVQQARRGKAHALNTGIREHTSGELVMCLDADSTVAPDALERVARHFEDRRVLAVASNVKIRPAAGLLNLIQRFEYVVCHQMKRAHTAFNIEYIIGGIGSTFRRSALERVGYFDTDTVTEDIDLTMKFLRLGNKEHRIAFASDVITYTESVLTVRGLMRQRFRWKYGRCQTFFKNSQLFFNMGRESSKLLTWGYLPFAVFADLAFVVEPFMIAYILYVILWFTDWVTLLSIVTVISSYIAMNIIAEDTIDWRQKLKLLPLVPPMYFLFYLLSVVEYAALARSYTQLGAIRRSIGGNNCSWQHVERAAA